jgi:SnoaL-like protein
MSAKDGGSWETQNFVEGFARGWSNPEPDGFSALFTPEVRLVAPLLPVTNGIPAAEKAFRRTFAVFHGMRGTVHDWAPHPDGVFIEFTLSASFGGQPVSWRGVDRFLLRQGKAVERLHYFDTRPVMLRTARLPRTWPGLARAGARPRPPYLEIRGHGADPGSGPPLVRAWAALWDGPSAEGLIDLLGPNGHYLVPGLPPIGVDAEGRERATSLFELLPHLQGQLVRWGQRNGSLYVEGQFRATVAGKLLRWPQVDRFDLEAGRINAVSAFLDTFPLVSRLARSREARKHLVKLAEAAARQPP